jgi:hypothetical protein
LTESGYLRRLASRRELDTTRRRTVFGLVLGWLAVLVGGLRWAFVPGGWTLPWAGLVLIGCLLLATATLVPSLLKGPESLLRRATGGIGRLILWTVLVLVFFAMMVPAGWLLRRRGGTAPYTWWTDEPPPDLEGWIDKEDPDPALATRLGRGAPLLSQPFLIVADFIQRGRYLLLPALCVLLVLGLVLFFVQTSALAPFLYSLF